MKGTIIIERLRKFDKTLVAEEGDNQSVCGFLISSNTQECSKQI